MKKRFKVAFLVMLALVLCITAATASAEWPEKGKTLTIIVNMDPGQAHDLMARTIAPYLSKYLGIDVVVDNVSGGAGLIGTRTVLNKPDDGYTLLTWSYPKLDVETVTPTDGDTCFYTYDDFYSIGSIMPEEHMLFVAGDSPFDTLQDVIDYAKDHPGELVFASSNPYPGVVGYVWEQLQNLTGTEFTFVPYSGASPVITAVMGGHADISSLGAGDIYEMYVKTGALKALCTARNSRNDMAPEVPSFVEATGMELPEYVGIANRAMMVRGSTDPEIIEKLVEAFKAAAEDPEFVEAYAKTGYVLHYMTPDEVNLARQQIIDFVSSQEN